MVNRRVAWSTLAVVTTGVLLHFALEWSGGHPLVTVFAATNESTWEHLKLAFWPALLVGFVQLRLYDAPPGWLPATAIRTLLPPLLIVGIFYGYTWMLGTHHLVLDLATFAIAVFTGELAGHAVMAREAPRGVRVAATAALAVAVTAFSTLTFRPPAWFLFEDPSDGPGSEASLERGGMSRTPGGVHPGRQRAGPTRRAG